MRQLMLERWPGLDLPWCSLGKWPSPVERMDIPQAPSVELWIKQEGQCAEPLGGVAVRKLEYLLGDALVQSGGDLITIGSVGSGHVRTAALYARQVGLRLYAGLTPASDGTHARQNARLIDAFCEGWFALPRRRAWPVAAVKAAWRIGLLGGARAHWLPPYGASGLGMIGWVGGGLELAEDIRSGRLPTLARVYVPTRSGTTVAGLWVGLRLAGVSTEVVAVVAGSSSSISRNRIRRMGRRAFTYLRFGGAELPPALPLHGLSLLRAPIQPYIDDPDLDIFVRSPHIKQSFQATVRDLASDASVGPALWLHPENTRPVTPLLAEALPRVPRRLAALLHASQRDSTRAGGLTGSEPQTPFG